SIRSAPRAIVWLSVVRGPRFSPVFHFQGRRNIILAMKESNNRAVRPHVGAVIHAALDYLVARGEIPATVALVPAPTRKKSAALRGGDPVRSEERRVGKEGAARWWW